MLCAAALASVASACQIPVFRYALERWAADDYQLIVLHDGPLKEAESKCVERLRAGAANLGSANYQLQVLPIDQVGDRPLKEVWERHAESGEPIMVSLYPESAKEVPDRFISAIGLTEKSVDLLSDSPLRRTIASRLTSGESAVWIFVPCGDKTKDQVALDTLMREVEVNEKSLELPEQEVIEDEKELLEQINIELRLDFSVVTLRREDPKEEFLLKMLLASEPDLEELDEPMAFPVLGRGRVLYALVGGGITATNISSASRFIIGPCSCQVKNQNPGFDLLMGTDWEQRIGKAKLSDPLPEQSGEVEYLAIPPGRNR